MRGDWTSLGLPSDSRAESIDTSRLGLEARSILKSIQTEEAKLLQSIQFTRSDKHYFRARYNYYRLSLLRLPPEERITLEPVLASFLNRITRVENEQDPQTEERPTPFLEAVGRHHPSQLVDEISNSGLSAKANVERVESSVLTSSPQPQAHVQEALSQLSLIKLALCGDLSADSRKILVEAVDRTIKMLRS